MKRGAPTSQLEVESPSKKANTTDLEKTCDSLIFSENKKWRPVKSEWDHAIALLTGKPSGTKLNKKNSKISSNFSFIIIEDKIYALSNDESFEKLVNWDANIKQGTTYDGKLYAIKISKEPYSEGTQIGKEVGLIISTAQREIRPDHYKYYTVMDWAGENLEDFCFSNKPNVAQSQIIALKTCLAVQALHQWNSVHRDIHAGNITVKQDPDNPYEIEVKLIDFDYSIKLPHGTEYFYDEELIDVGQGFSPPEARTKGQFSKSSDNYSVVITLLTTGLLPNIIPDNKIDVINKYSREYNCGRTWPHFLKFLEDQNITLLSSEEMIKALLAPEPEKRASLDILIDYLRCQLAQDPNFEKKLITLRKS